MRKPAVAGAFYPGSGHALRMAIEKCFQKAKSPETKGTLLSVISPHAGYVYSGWVAAFAYSALKSSFRSAPTFVIIGPNHTGYGSGVSLSLDDWETPLGIAKNDTELGRLIQSKSKYIDLDESAHLYEHSIEVQIPFLQYIYEDVKVVPICVMMQDPEVAEDIAKAVYEAEKISKRNVFLIASSDFTHFEHADVARKKDHQAIEYIRKLDPSGFYSILKEDNISICGYAPIMSAMEYARFKGCDEVRVLRYANSGDVTGDYNSVVAYCSVAFLKTG